MGERKRTHQGLVPIGLSGNALAPSALAPGAFGGQAIAICTADGLRGIAVEADPDQAPGSGPRTSPTGRTPGPPPRAAPRGRLS